MRTLILYTDNLGNPQCGCIIHLGDFDPTAPADEDWKNQLTEFPDEGIYFAVHDIPEEVIDEIYVNDESGNEIGKQYVRR